MSDETDQFDASKLAPADVLTLVTSMNSQTTDGATIDPGEYPAFDYEMNVRFVSSREWDEEFGSPEEDERESFVDQPVDIPPPVVEGERLPEAIGDGSPSRMRQTRSDSGSTRREARSKGLRLDDEEKAQLGALESELLGWIGESKNNAAEFVLDPIGVIDRVGTDIDPQLVSKLRRIREQNLARSPGRRRARLAELTVENAMEESG